MACEVRESAELGRYYVAARPVAAGEQARVGFPSGYGGVEGLERQLLPSGFGAEIRCSTASRMQRESDP